MSILTKEVKRLLTAQLEQPDEEFVRFFASRIYEGSKTQKVMQQFTDITARAFRQFITDQMNERLRTVLGSEAPSVASGTARPADGTTEGGSITEGNDRGIVTTDEEKEAYLIVKAILREDVDPKRVAMRDGKTYCSVLLDDNNRKPICRFWFGSTRNAIGLFDADRVEQKMQICDLNDIYQHATTLRATVEAYRPRESMDRTHLPEHSS